MDEERGAPGTHGFDVGRRVERPLGFGRAAPGAHLLDIHEDECWELLSHGGVGRFVFLAARGPVAVPVNYRVVDGAVVLRTAPESSVAEVRDGEAVSLEIDHIDEATREGWSVLASGTLEHLDDPAVDQLSRAGVEPWADPERRHTYLRFVPIEVTGRRILARR